LSQTLVTSGSTNIVGCAVIFPSNASNGLISLWNGTNVVMIGQTSATNPELVIRTGTARATSGLAGTILYTSSTGGLGTTTFHYVEVKVIWAATTGRVICKLDGIQIYDSGTTVNLGSTTGAVNLDLAGSYAATANFSLADLVCMDGSGSTFNDFQGDVRIETLFPKADGSNSGFTPVPTNILPSTNVSRFSTDSTAWTGVTWTRSTMIYQYGDIPKYGFYLTTSNTGVAVSATGTSGFAVTAGNTYTLCAYITGQSGYGGVTGGLNFYNSSGTIIGSGQSCFTGIQPGSGSWYAAFGSTTAPVGAATAAAYFSQSNPGGYGMYGVGVYAGTLPGFVYVDPGNPHWEACFEPHGLDGDYSYNGTNTVNSKDTYQMTSLVSTSGGILGVVSNLVARKDSATPRALTPVVRVGSTDYQGATAYTLLGTLAYGLGQNLWAVSPATSAAWTRTEINAMELGAQLTT